MAPRRLPNAMENNLMSKWIDAFSQVLSLATVFIVLLICTMGERVL